MNLHRIGVWAHELRIGEESARREAAALLEELGYGTLWFPGMGNDDSMDCARVLLDATRGITVATGITNIWTEDPAAVAADRAALVRTYGERLVLGLGISHRHFVNSLGGNYDRPLAAMNVYLDALDAAPEPPPADARVIAALGPRMLQVSRERAAGTHPYLVTPEHTRIARAAVGPDRVVAPEQTVVLEPDPVRARALARGFLKLYLVLPNYSATWKRLGLTEEDIAGGGSDRLVDALVAWGDEEAIAARVQEHLDAGADHVCIQVVHDGDGAPVEQWTRLADALHVRT